VRVLSTLPVPCYVISDAHLGVTPPEVERRLLRFFRELDGRAASLVVNGDLFDFWFGWRRVMPRTGFRVLAALADLRERGLPILWLGGNHDCWGGDVLREEVGVEYHLGDWRGLIGSWRTRISHGDGLREREDRAYRWLRTVLRNPWAIRMFRWLHPDLATRLALGSSRASRTYRARDRGEGLRQVAIRDLRTSADLDLLIFAHSHVAALERSPEAGVYANAGTWMDDTTYLRIDQDQIALWRWSESGEDACLASVSRPALVSGRLTSAR
jgi:UDP-2,3-diacylglucosamine hydrolase